MGGEVGDFIEDVGEGFGDFAEHTFTGGFLGEAIRGEQLGSGLWGGNGGGPNFNRDHVGPRHGSPYSVPWQNGSPSVLPHGAGGSALAWQHRANMEAEQFRRTLYNDARGALSQGQNLFQSYRPGGAAALASGLYQGQAQVSMTQAQSHQAPDLLMHYRHVRNEQARHDAKKAADRAMLGGLIQGGASILGAAVGGPAGAAVGSAVGGAVGGAVGSQAPANAGIDPSLYRGAPGTGQAVGGAGLPGGPGGSAPIGNGPVSPGGGGSFNAGMAPGAPTGGGGGDPTGGGAPGGPQAGPPGGGAERIGGSGSPAGGAMGNPGQAAASAIQTAKMMDSANLADRQVKEAVKRVARASLSAYAKGPATGRPVPGIGEKKLGPPPPPTSGLAPQNSWSVRDQNGNLIPRPPEEFGPQLPR